MEVDGFSGLSLDIGVPAYAECPLPYVLVWAIPVGEGGEFVQMANQQSRFVILDVEGDVIVIAIESFPGVPFGGFLDAATELIETIRITPGAYIPAEPIAEPEASRSPAVDRFLLPGAERGALAHAPAPAPGRPSTGFRHRVR